MIVEDEHGPVTISRGATIEDTAIIIGPAFIGEDAYIGHGAVIGAPPQYRGVYPSPVTGKRFHRGVRVGNDACVRELVQIHQGILFETYVGDDTLLMAGCHIGHDSEIGSNCSLAPFSLLAGHTILCDGVTFGQGVITHPWVIVGEHAMIGLNSGVLDDVLPYQKVVGSPAKLIGKNTGAMGIRKGWDLHDLDTEVVKRYVAVRVRRDNNKKLMKELMER